MKVKQKYSFSNDRQIWRIIPGGEGKIVLEEREPATREVFFSCLELNSGNVIFNSLQFEEKFWTGI